MADPQQVSLLTDGQVAALVSALVTVGGAMVAAGKWAVNRITKALDDNSAVHREVASANVEHAKAMTALSVKIDHVTEWVEEHTPVTDPESPLARRTADNGPTPRGGYGLNRPPRHPTPPVGTKKGP